jgi:hypothetical protein
MRIAILSLLLLIYAQASLATQFQMQLAGIGGHPPAKHASYSKGKGVFGLMTGLFLGPVGYAAICIFSHDRNTRKKALLGMEIWTCVALSVLVIYLICKSGAFSGSGKGSGSKGSVNSKSVINLGNVNIYDPGSNQRKRKQATPVPPIIMMPYNPARR